MWIFMREGAVSVVEDFKSAEHVWVRSRIRSHLNAFLRPLPKKFRRVASTPDADYAFRVKLPRERFKEAVLVVIDQLDYTNFKNSIEDTAYHSACSKVWQSFLNACRTGCYAVRSTLFPTERSSEIRYTDEELNELFGDKDADRAELLHTRL